MADSRSKKRLLIVTTILLAVIGVMIFSSSKANLSYHKSIGEILKDPSYIGKSVKVGGKIMEGSIEQKGNVCTFKIFDKDGEMTIVYTGQLPNQFGADIEAIVDGKLVAQDKVESKKMVTKCPSKYKSKVEEE